MRKKKTSSILRKFLVFNLTVFSILGLFTIIYLEAIQPNLVNKRVSNHNIIIKNTTDHLERLNVKLNKEEINKFLLSTGFIFQGLDRVQFFSLDGELVGDTNILDLDPKVFLREDPVLFNLQNEDGNLKIDNENNFSSNQEKLSDNLIKNINNGSFVTQGVIKKNFVVSTYNKIEIDNDLVGFIKVSEQANDILIAVEERKNFIIRTVLGYSTLDINFFFILK